MLKLTLKLRTPPQAKKFARRQDLLCRDVHELSLASFAALFVERIGTRWAIYHKDGTKRSQRVFFDTEPAARKAWRTILSGDLSPITHFESIKQRDLIKKFTPKAPSQKDSGISFWMKSYLYHSNGIKERTEEANRIIATLSKNHMDIFSKKWWEENIPSTGISKAIYSESKTVTKLLSAPLNKVQKVTRIYISKRLRLLTSALMFAKLMAEEEYPFNAFDKMADAIKLNFKSGNSVDFNPGNNYQPLSVTDLETLLKAISKKGLPYYNFAILCLSSIIRYRDVKMIKKEFLSPDGRLTYNKEVMGHYLSNKTLLSGKVDPSRLANPQASLVTKVILKYLKFTPFSREVELAIFSPKSKVRKVLSENGQDHGVVRCLRTTGATMLAESTNSDSCRRLTKKEVVERLAHVNGKMLETVYGRIRPPEMGEENIDEYLDIPEVRIGNELVNPNEAAFDVWLLGNMLETYRGRKEEADLNRALQSEVAPIKSKKTKKTIKV